MDNYTFGLILGFAIVIYFLPTVVAFHKKNCAAIFTLNLFLGWTFLGWVGALVWAVATPKFRRA